MNKAGLVKLLSTSLPAKLAEDLVESFIQLRRDVSTNTLGRTDAGKFVESFVQVMQGLETGKHEKKPDVDYYLRAVQSRPGLDDGLRICAARVARAMYSLRNKRSIAHKGEIDPNKYDLQFLLSAAQWALAELVRVVGSSSMADAGRFVAQIQAPVGGLVEDFGDKQLVLRNMTVRQEILVLAHHHYPNPLTTPQVTKSMQRRSAGAVRAELRKLWDDKLLEGDGKAGYQLTSPGFETAVETVAKYVD